MVAISQNSCIFISGVSGFIALHTAKEALKKGFQVVGTVRSESKGEYVKKVLNSDKFSYTIVEDISKPNAFDKAIQTEKFDGVLHMASPFHRNAVDPKEVYEPAIEGTKSILESIYKYGPTVKRCVVTSSFAAILRPSVKAPYTYTEKDWNTESAKIVEEKHKNGDTKDIGAPIYTASKALAEKAAWDFLEEHKDAKFDLSTVNPVLVWGAAIQEVPKPEALNTSNAVVYELMKGNLKESDLPGFAGNYVHVTDVADAHVECLLREEAGSQRYLLSDRGFSKQEVAEILMKLDPSLDLPKGKPNGAKEAISPENVPQTDHTKTTRELGIKFRGIEECIKDTYDSIKQLEKQWK